MRKLKYFLLGVAVSFAIGILSLDQSFPAIDPSIWRVYAEATGLWPSTAVTPVLWRRLVSLGCAPSAISAVAVAVFAFAVFDTLWRLLVVMVCPQKDFHNWWRLTVPALSLLGSLLAVFSEPVWRLTLSAAPALLTLALFVLAVDLFLVSFFTKIMLDEEGLPESTVRPNLGVYTALLLAGFLSVETPAALLLPLLFAGVHRLLLPRIMDGRYQDHPDDLLVFSPIRFSNWGAFFLWLAGALLAIPVSDLPKNGDGILRYLFETLQGLQGAASLLGWVLWTGCTLIPFALACGLLPVLTAKERQLEFGLGLVALVTGVASLVVVSPAARGDWAFIPFAVVRSSFLQALGAVLSAHAAVLSLAVFSHYAFHAMPRDHHARTLVVEGVALALLAAAVIAGWGMRRDFAQEVRQVIADAIEETVREAKGLSWIFTDGSADVGIELVARRHHADLRTRPLITGGPRAASRNSAALLGDWICENSSNLQASAVQVGFELWKRERKPAWPASGFLARADWPEGARDRGIAVAEQLGARMVELSRAGLETRETDQQVRDVFAALLWRLSRLARQRGDTARADELDAANVAVRNMTEKIRRERQAAFLQMSDSEGLQLALQRADFVEARHYAASVLKRLPEDVPANFGMGMSCLEDGHPRDAVLYFERAHKGKPTEPAILNNLAIAHLRAGNLAEAEAWAKKAIERAPDVPEVKDTFRQVEEAKRK